MNADESARLHLQMELRLAGRMACLQHCWSRCVVEHQHGARIGSTDSDFHGKEEESRIAMAHFASENEESHEVELIISHGKRNKKNLRVAKSFTFEAPA